MTAPIVLGLSVYWLTAAMLSAAALLIIYSHFWATFVMLYVCNVIQIGWYGRQLGTFRWLTALSFPISLVFYFVIFAQSAWRRRSGGPVTWRGRQL